MSEDPLNICCHLCKSSYTVGEIGVVLLTGHGSHSLDNAIIFGQVHGHLNTDSRWIKSQSVLNDLIRNSVEQKDHIPLDPNPAHSQQKNSFCIFSTSRVTISPSHLYDSGVLLEFEIPSSCIPSFKGLSGGVSYYLSLSIQASGGLKQIHYPLTVNGSCSATANYMTNSFSCLVCYPVTSLPVESFYADISTNDPLSQDPQAGVGRGNTIYNIKDKDHICRIHRKQEAVLPGQDIQLLLDFSDSLQSCLAVKAALVLKETRGDGSRIQDKILFTVVRDTLEAQHLHLHLPLPADSVCTFECPVFKAFYHLEIEFCLEQNNDILDNQLGMFDNAFSFVIPIEVVAALPSSDGVAGDMVRNNKGKSAQQQVSMCMEANIVSFPVFG